MEPTPKPDPRISIPAMAEIEAALKGYRAAVLDSDLKMSSQGSYIDKAEYFVEWMKGEFEPGVRKEPYRMRKAIPPSVTSTASAPGYLSRPVEPPRSRRLP
jgi:hypothetical protein